MPKRTKNTAAQKTAANSIEKAGAELFEEQPSPAEIDAARKTFPKIMDRLRAKALVEASDPQITLFGSIRKKEKARQILAKEILATSREIEKLKKISFHDRDPLPRDPFVMMPRRLMLATDIRSQDKILFCLLMSYCRGKTYAWPSQELLADQLAVTPRSIQRSLNQLIDHGYILVQVHRKTNGCRHINAYVLNLADDRGRYRP